MLIYKCSVCKSDFSSRVKWHEHLPQRKHQELARKQLAGWGDADERAKILVFVKLPGDKDVEIINQLSAHAESAITDFVVTSEERPRIGMVQFETRKQLLRVLMSLEDKEDQFYIEGSWCEVRDAGVITELEWLKYLPEDMTFGPESEDDAATEHAHDRPLLLPPPAKRIKMENVEQAKEETAFEKLGLRHHLSYLKTLIEIPDEEYNTALEITRALQQSLIESKGYARPRSPSLKAVLCRNWLLKLKYSPSTDLDNVGCAVHIYSDPPGSCSTEQLKKGVTQFFHEAAETLGYNVIQMEPDNRLGICDSSTKKKKNEEGGDSIKRHRFQPLDSTAPPFLMNFVYRADFLVETQVWRLLKYLCSFDTRCFPVLSLAYYWAKTNRISIGKGYCHGTPGSISNPCGLSWLVIFFFQSEELIPDTRSVLERDHEPLHLIFDHSYVDLGFSYEDEYAASWRDADGRKLSYDSSDAGKEKFAQDVFNLFYKFLLFYGTRLGKSSTERGWILSTRDCERISMDEVVEGKVVESKFLASTQLTGIWKASQSWRIVMTNPFFSNGRISTTSNAGRAFEAMEKTGLKLKGYFDVGTDVKRGKLELADFLDLMKI